MTRRNMLLRVALVLVVVFGAGTYGLKTWQSRQAANNGTQLGKPSPSISDESTPVRLSPEALKNLGIVSKPVRVTNYWRKLDVPGIVIDRPGISDRGVVAPVTGIVKQIHAYPGHTVNPEAPLFTLRLVSESLHSSQLELFKATKEIEILKQQRERLAGVAQTGAVSQSRIIEIDNQIQRMDVNVQAYKQDLLSRGLPAEHLDAAAQGKFITEIIVRAPVEQAIKFRETAATTSDDEPQQFPFRFEMHALQVELGAQVEAGEVLCFLADHRSLLIEGRGFKKDMPHIHHAAKNQLPIELALEVEEGSGWPALSKQLQIDHVANLIDTESRTFAFHLPLDNQRQSYVQNGEDRLIWRFRPGDRVRLSVAVEKLDNVFVLPRAAVVQEGPEAFVFRQNGNLFDRLPIHVLHEDSVSIVIASDGRVRPGFYIAQNAAASLQRVLKAQMASGTPTNVHVHADGTVHEAH